MKCLLRMCNTSQEKSISKVKDKNGISQAKKIRNSKIGLSLQTAAKKAYVIRGKRYTRKKLNVKVLMGGEVYLTTIVFIGSDKINSENKWKFNQTLDIMRRKRLNQTLPSGWFWKEKRIVKSTTRQYFTRWDKADYSRWSIAQIITSIAWERLFIWLRNPRQACGIFEGESRRNSTNLPRVTGSSTNLPQVMLFVCDSILDWVSIHVTSLWEFQGCPIFSHHHYLHFALHFIINQSILH